MLQFDTIDYLKTGNALQQQAYMVLTSEGIMQRLEKFSPVLSGTIPININIEGSDLDVLCCFENAEEFAAVLNNAFQQHKQYILRKKEIDGIPAIIANFLIERFEIEIFGQSLPVKEQNGYRHMITEHNILKEKGETFRKEIIRLKQSGLKTEPAFALLLGLEGDPYKALLDYGC